MPQFHRTAYSDETYLEAVRALLGRASRTIQRANAANNPHQQHSDAENHEMPAICQESPCTAAEVRSLQWFFHEISHTDLQTMPESIEKHSQLSQLGVEILEHKITDIVRQQRPELKKKPTISLPGIMFNDLTSPPNRPGLLKRISKALYNDPRWKIELTPSQREDLGNTIAKYTLSPRKTTYHIRFTQDLYWVRGTYGDGRSCFWTCHAGGRKALLDMGAYAALLYKNTLQNPIPHGRFWVMPVPGRNELALAFNGYPPVRNIGMLPYIEALASHLSLKTRLTSVTNRGAKDDGNLYFNNGTGYLLSKHKIPKALTTRMNIETKPLQCCHRCGSFNGLSGNGVCLQCDALICSSCDNFQESTRKVSCEAVASPVYRRWCHQCFPPRPPCIICNTEFRLRRSQTVTTICPHCKERQKHQETPGTPATPGTDHAT